MTTWKLNAIEIPEPNRMYFEPFRVERSDRVASGLMVKDIIAIKRRFILEYEELDADEIGTFVTLFESGAFMTFTYKDRGQWRTATVDMCELPREMYLSDPELWIGITVELEQV